MFRKRKDSKGFLLCPMKQQKFDRSCTMGIDCKINATWDRRCPVDLIETRADFKTAYNVQWDQMDRAGQAKILRGVFGFCLCYDVWCCDQFFLVHSSPPE